MQYNLNIHVAFDPHLAQLGLRVHKDLTHFTLEVLAGHPDTTFAAKPLALAACTSCHHLPPASRQDTMTFQHQFVLCTWWGEQDNWQVCCGTNITGLYLTITNQKSTANDCFEDALTAVMCFQLGD